jgi:G3E family GTPase
MKLDRINVFIITGFLGAGKTTLLNKILPDFNSDTTIVIENEIGKVSIDSRLINSNYSELYDLSNGCICCSLDSDLLKILSSIIINNESHENLFIETTGIADAGSVASVFKKNEVKEHFYLRKIICLVDCRTFEDYLPKVEELQKQISSADTIILTNLEFVSTEDLTKIKYLISIINPFGNVIEKDFQKSDLFTENEQRTIHFSKTYSSINQHKISSILYTSKEMFNIEQLNKVLTFTMNLYYNQIYRIKGFVQLENGQSCLVQTTGKHLELSITNQVINETQLIFIGRQIENKTIERILKPVISKRY